jgi:uncharacterized protein with GYD domain
MAKYLITGSYTPEGTKGLLREGGSGRKSMIEKAVKDLGGSVEAFYFAYGETDVVVIAEIPDAVSGLALSLAANASGTVKVRTVPLIAVEDVDAACKKTTSYRGAGV